VKVRRGAEGTDGRYGRNTSIPGNSGEPSRARVRPQPPPRPKMFPKRGSGGAGERSPANCRKIGWRSN
jgi:hypothetical protein